MSNSGSRLFVKDYVSATWRVLSLLKPLAGALFAGEPDGITFLEDIIRKGIGGKFRAVEDADYQTVIVAQFAAAKRLAGHI